MNPGPIEQTKTTDLVSALDYTELSDTDCSVFDFIEKSSREIFDLLELQEYYDRLDENTDNTTQHSDPKAPRQKATAVKKVVVKEEVVRTKEQIENHKETLEELRVLRKEMSRPIDFTLSDIQDMFDKEREERRTRYGYRSFYESLQQNTGNITHNTDPKAPRQKATAVKKVVVKEEVVHIKEQLESNHKEVLRELRQRNLEFRDLKKKAMDNQREAMEKFRDLKKKAMDNQSKAMEERKAMENEIRAVENALKATKDALIKALQEKIAASSEEAIQVTTSSKSTQERNNVICIE